MLYIHIPYCHRKCTYCAFYSQAGQHDREAYLEALCREIAMREEPQRKVRTLYFGGGTPSLLSLKQLERVMECLSEHFDLSLMEEATLEANPEDITPSYAEGLRRLGFNRLSLGVQSFGDADLKVLNRVHNAHQALDAIAIAQRAGFDNISIDLMYGLPGQTVEDWQHNLSFVQSLGVQHLSCYALTVEEGTMLDRQIAMGRVLPATEAVVEQQYRALCQWAQAVGYEQYEVSNFSLPGFHSRHNSRYWDRTPYLGFGAAAHSFDGQRRRWNIAFLPTYLSGKDYYEEEVLSEQDAYNEYVMTALRTTRGIDKAWVAHLPHLSRQIAKYVAAGLIVETPQFFRPTAEGLLHADGIAADCFL